MNYYAFDMMGDMAFGKSFDMLKTGEKVCYIEAHRGLFSC
jgi:tryprostatin B 6-hydroxylase